MQFQIASASFLPAETRRRMLFVHFYRINAKNKWSVKFRNWKILRRGCKAFSLIEQELSFFLSSLKWWIDKPIALCSHKKFLKNSTTWKEVEKIFVSATFFNCWATGGFQECRSGIRFEQLLAGKSLNKPVYVLLLFKSSPMFKIHGWIDGWKKTWMCWHLNGI